MWLLNNITPVVWCLIGIALPLLRRLSSRRPSSLPVDDPVEDLTVEDPVIDVLVSKLLSDSRRSEEELIKARKNAAKSRKTTKSKKTAKKARGFGSVQVTPKADKKLSLEPAGLDQPDLYGITNYEIKVLEFLEHGTTSMQGILGKRGMGKSTLLMLVFTSSRQSLFRYRFYVEACIGFTADMLLRSIARNIGLDPISAVPAVISTFLQDQSFILLLDDLHVSFDMSAAGLPMPLGPRQKVVFTTRYESICDEMGSAGNIIRMEPLEDDIAWDLFRYNVGGNIIRPDSKIEDLAKKMVAECRGIPDALCTVGRSMATQEDVCQWIVAYDMLTIKRPPLHKIEETDDEDYPCLDYF